MPVPGRTIHPRPGALRCPAGSGSGGAGRAAALRRENNVPEAGSPRSGALERSCHGIDGTARSGQILGATADDVADSSGLEAETFSYQWILVEIDSTQNEVEGAAESTYTLTEDTVDTTVKVRVSCAGGDGFAELVTSETFPSGVSIGKPQRGRAQQGRLVADRN